MHLLVERLRLLVQGGTLLDGHKALDAERLAGLGDRDDPLGDVLVGLLAGGGRLLGDDLRTNLFASHFHDRGKCKSKSRAENTGYQTS